MSYVDSPEEGAPRPFFFFPTNKTGRTSGPQNRNPRNYNTLIIYHSQGQFEVLVRSQSVCMCLSGLGNRLCPGTQEHTRWKAICSHFNAGFVWVNQGMRVKSHYLLRKCLPMMFSNELVIKDLISSKAKLIENLVFNLVVEPETMTFSLS